MGTSINPAGGHRAAEHLDADAVCAQCGTVNPEETLMCKTCGNNLRDQRQMRLAAEAQMDGETVNGNRRQFVRSALAVLGLLVVLWTALNVATIQQWMINAQVENVNIAESLFLDEQAPLYNDLMAELRANLPTEEEKKAAVSSPVPVTDYSGYYVIVTRDGESGSALLQRQEQGTSEGGTQSFSFVSLLAEAEIRGVASLRGNNLTADWNSTGLRYQDEYIPASGVVIQQENGSFDGFGQSAITEFGHPFTAYKIAR